jgi:ankyrin repeat protein
MAGLELSSLSVIDKKCIAAALDGNALSVEAYLRRGARAQSVCSDYLLQSLAQQGSTDVIRVLLDAGAPIEWLPIKNGYTPLQAAVVGGQTETSKFLIERLIAEDRDTSGLLGDALRMAAWHGRRSIVDYLLDVGADVNAAGDRAETPLMWAARNGHVEITKLLLERGAEPNAVSDSQMTAIRLATKYGREDAVVLLRHHGAKESTLSPSSLQDKFSGILIKTVKRIVGL